MITTFADIATIENLGWLATAVFVASFFASSESKLKLIQLVGASIWVLYGFLIKANPVIVANLLVIAAILLSFGRKKWHSRQSRLGRRSS